MHRCLGLSLVVLALAGCGKPKTAFVSGSFYYKGRAVENCQVTFHDTNPSKPVPPIFGDIGPGGRFNLQIPPGEYKVTIKETTAGGAIVDRQKKSVVRLVPDKYRDPEKSGLTATVKLGENQPLTFNLTE